MGTSEERNGARHGRREGGKRAGEGLREERMEQGSKEMKLQRRYPEYTVSYSHPIPQRALAIATLLLQISIKLWKGFMHTARLIAKLHQTADVEQPSNRCTSCYHIGVRGS